MFGTRSPKHHLVGSVTWLSVPAAIKGYSTALAFDDGYQYAPASRSILDISLSNNRGIGIFKTFAVPN